MNAISAIRGYTAGYDFAQFAADNRTADAVLHNLAIIGEAASKLPQALQQQAPDIEWRKIVGFRNIVIHEYFGVNRVLVWDIVTNKLDPLDAACRLLLEK